MMFEQAMSLDLLSLLLAFSLLSAHDIHRLYKKIGS
jgi:hypothetical protein